MNVHAVEQINAQAREWVANNEQVEKFLSGVAPTAAKYATTALTGNTVAGEVVGATVSGISRTNSRVAAEMVAGPI